MGRRRVPDRGGDPEDTEEHRFQGIAEHDESNFIYDLAFFGISRSKNVILVQVTLAEGRTLEQKPDSISALEPGAKTGPSETARRPS